MIFTRFLAIVSDSWDRNGFRMGEIFMRPLTLEDLFPLEEFRRHRRTLFESHRRYLDRHRRVPVGPRTFLLFENRQTLWFRLQEMLLMTGLTDREQIQAEIRVYNQFLPARDRLQAVLQMELAEENSPGPEEEAWKTFQGEELRLHLGNSHQGAVRVSRGQTPDPLVNRSHWIELPVNSLARKKLQDPENPAWLELDLAGYKHQSAWLAPEVRQSLVDDLELSDRD